MSRSVPCYFSISYGLQGCYMPDSHLGPFVATRRKDIIEAVRDALEFYDAPRSAIRQVRWTHLWSQAKRYGTSSIHFSIAVDKHNCISFHGLTEAEYNEQNTED